MLDDQDSQNWRIEHDMPLLSSSRKRVKIKNIRNDKEDIIINTIVKDKWAL